MKTAIIRQRVADFLKGHSPFDVFSEPDLLAIAASGRVKFHESEEYVFRQGDAPGQFVWVIQQGRVELLEGTAEGERLRDVSGEGDMLGLERFAGHDSYLYSARTASDVILYGVAAATFESLSATYPSVRRFLSAHFSGSASVGFNRTSWLDADGPPLEFLRARLVSLPGDAAAPEIAAALADSRNGLAAFVHDDGRAIGTVSALELCTNRLSDVRTSQPAVAPVLTTRAAIRQMLRHRTDRVSITADGTSGGRLQALLTGPELALFCGHNPAHLIRAIRHAASVAELEPLLRRATRMVLDGLAQPHDVDDCCLIGIETTSALAEACIRMAHADVVAAGIEAPSVPYCWVMFGTAARGDSPGPCLPTIAAVYDDSEHSYQTDDSLYFAALAGETVARFHACELDGPGLYWPDGARPSMPLSEWKRLYSETIRNPLGHDLYARREFFDLSPLTGDASILSALQDHILLELRDHQTAIPLFANDTLAQLPPLTFFRGLVLDLDGAQRDGFNIEEAVVNPLTAAARVFALAKRRLSPAGTLERLKAATLDFPEAAAILREAAHAFRIGLYYQALAGSPRIDPGTLGKFDQLLLKAAFSSIQRFLQFIDTKFIWEA